MQMFSRYKRKKRNGTKTTYDSHVFLTVTNASWGPDHGLNIRVLADERSVNEARYDADRRRPDAFFVVHKIPVETIRPWYLDERDQ